LSILIYHRVLAEADPLRTGDPDAATFGWQMDLLARHFNVLPLHEAALRLKAGTLPARAACVTFDDGYADNYSTALPILKRTGVPATFFIASGYLDGGRMFNDTLIELAKGLPTGSSDLSSAGLGHLTINTISDRKALVGKLLGHFKYQAPEQRLQAAENLASKFDIQLPDNLMMSSTQLKALHAEGMEIGAHTHTHPILARQHSADAIHDIRLGKEKLERLLGAPMRVFAYPNGRPVKDYGDEHVAMIRENGFDTAVSTRPAAADRNSDIYQLPRFTPWDKTPARFALRLLRALVQPHSAGG
jgi:peptidoglycan/xylan/chitin deacetylase (PgdA/CDA1 family)